MLEQFSRCGDALRVQAPRRFTERPVRVDERLSHEHDDEAELLVDDPQLAPLGVGLGDVAPRGGPRGAPLQGSEPKLVTTPLAVCLPLPARAHGVDRRHKRSSASRTDVESCAAIPQRSVGYAASFQFAD